MTKTYNLQVTEEQLKVISTACELLSRIQGGQIREAFEHLPLKKDIDWSVGNHSTSRFEFPASTELPPEFTSFGLTLPPQA